MGLGVLTGCAALDTKQGQWIFNPTDRHWSDTQSIANGMQEHWIEYTSTITGKPDKLHALVSPAAAADAPHDKMVYEDAAATW